MPNRLCRLAAALRARRNGPAFRPARPEINDNSDAGHEEATADPPEPLWHGPGRVISLGVRNGRYGLGTVRAFAPGEGTAEPADEADTLQRLLAHYGLWLGFQGRMEPVIPGRLRRLSDPAGTGHRVEYQLDLRRISRDAQRLTADGTILIDGRPVMALEGFTILFRPAGRAGTARRAREA